MRQQKGLFQLGLLLAFPFLVGALCKNSSLAVNQSIWTHKNVTNYTMTVTVLWLPIPASEVQVTVRSGKLTNEKLLQCEVGQPEYSASTCNTLTTYYYQPGGDRTYTIDQLFQKAQLCTKQTITVVARYGLGYQLGFTGFTSSDAMYDFENAYRTSLQNTDWLCSVQYDPQYGYPTEIVTSAGPYILDGVVVVAVKNFHVDD